MVARVRFPWLTSWWNTIISQPTGDHQGNKSRTQPLPTALAPTDCLASCLTSRLRVMPIGRSLAVVLANKASLLIEGESACPSLNLASPTATARMEPLSLTCSHSSSVRAGHLPESP
jgi:hypothetical protein